MCMLKLGHFKSRLLPTAYSEAMLFNILCNLKILEDSKFP